MVWNESSERIVLRNRNYAKRHSAMIPSRFLLQSTFNSDSSKMDYFSVVQAVFRFIDPAMFFLIFDDIEYGLYFFHSNKTNKNCNVNRNTN